MNMKCKHDKHWTREQYRDMVKDKKTGRKCKCPDNDELEYRHFLAAADNNLQPDRKLSFLPFLCPICSRMRYTWIGEPR